MFDVDDKTKTSFDETKAIWDSLTDLQKIQLYEDIYKDEYTDLVEDSYEYDNGLLILTYPEKISSPHDQQEDSYFCVDLDNVNDYLEALSGF